MVGRLLTYTRARAHISLSFIYLTQIVTQREREQDPRVGAAGVALPSGGGGKLEGRNAVSAFLNRGKDPLLLAPASGERVRGGGNLAGIE